MPLSSARPGSPGTVYFSLLGPLSAVSDGRPLPLGPRKQRLVLATLLSRPNTPVQVDVLTDVVWPEGPPRTARKNLQVYVSAARALFGAVDGDDRGRVVHDCGGYRLRVEEGELDTLRFRTLARAGRAASERGDLRTAARLLREALDLWGSVRHCTTSVIPPGSRRRPNVWRPAASRSTRTGPRPRSRRAGRASRWTA